MAYSILAVKQRYNLGMSRVLGAPSVRRRVRLPSKRWITRAEFEQLIESGVFAPEERLELLAG
ncbi:MAG: hypothetical protein NZ556_07710, partial [Fimbriimonadales bacterium]|nr:hypothetical protein [Fimbriimonadales bacterium]